MEDIFFVFTVRYGDHWPWCSGAQLPSLKLAHGRRKNRRNISAEIYNAVKMSLFPFPRKVMGGEQRCSSRTARRTADWV